MGKKVIILGGIGNGSVIANAIKDANLRGDKSWLFEGYLNDREDIGSLIAGDPVLGTTNDAKPFVDKGYFFINTILRIDGQSERISIFEKLKIPENQLATFIHPTAYVAPDVVFKPGCVVMPNVSISSGTQFGIGCIVMVAATIGHDNTIGNFCHIAAQACVGAYLNIGIGVHIGLNCTIRENISLGDYSTVGMGAVLLKDVGNKEIWAGNPAKFIRKAE